MAVRHVLAAACAVAFSAFSALPSRSEESVSLTLGPTAFEPATLSVPAGEKIKLVVKNTSTKLAEFESHELKREKVIGAGASVTVLIGPLQPGTYEFFDDFNPSVKGHIVAK